MSAASKRYNGDKLPDNILKYIKGERFEGTNRDHMLRLIEDLHQTGKGGTMLGQAKQLLLDISECWNRFEVIRTKQVLYMSKIKKCEETIEVLHSNNKPAKYEYLRKLCVQFHEDFRHTCDFRVMCDKNIKQKMARRDSLTKHLGADSSSYFHFELGFQYFFEAIEAQQRQLFWNSGKIMDSKFKNSDSPQSGKPINQMFEACEGNKQSNDMIQLENFANLESMILDEMTEIRLIQSRREKLDSKYHALMGCFSKTDSEDRQAARHVQLYLSALLLEETASVYEDLILYKTETFDKQWEIKEIQKKTLENHLLLFDEYLTKEHIANPSVYHIELPQYGKPEKNQDDIKMMERSEKLDVLFAELCREWVLLPDAPQTFAEDVCQYTGNTSLLKREMRNRKHQSMSQYSNLLISNMKILATNKKLQKK